MLNYLFYPTLGSNTDHYLKYVDKQALYCNPYNYIDIASNILLILQSEVTCQQLRIEGQKHAANFNWEQCVVNTFKILEEVAVG